MLTKKDAPPPMPLGRTETRQTHDRKVHLRPRWSRLEPETPETLAFFPAVCGVKGLGLRQLVPTPEDMDSF